MFLYMRLLRMLVVSLCVAPVASLFPAQANAATQGRPAAAAYMLGVDDVIAIHALHITDIPERPLRIDADGYINLPLVGRVHAAGLTSSQLENLIRERLDRLVNDPQVVVDVVEQKSQPVVVLGSVKTPGTHQLRGPKTLLEVISLAGGIEQDAGNTIRITRRREEGSLGLPNARPDAGGDATTAELNLKEIMDGISTAGSMIVKPHDTISVPRGRMVYAIGEIRKPGGFILRDRENVSVLQVLSLAEGLNRTAGPANARILRPNPDGGTRLEVPVNLNHILSGKEADVPLQPDDILFVPNSAARSGALRALEAAIQLGTGVVIWRR